MSFLTAATSAAIRLGVNKPSTFFSGTGRFEQEIVDLADEVATDIIKAHDWRVLIKQYQMVGDGTTSAFDLPGDYDRMPKNGDVQRANWYTWGYVDTPDLNFWRDLKNGLVSPNPGYWIILDGKIQFQPAVEAGTTAEFYYVSKAAMTDADTQVRKTEFTKDSDTFVLDERLLTLGLIWRWRAMKRLDYSEYLQNYEIRLMQISAEDKGARVIRMGRSTLPYDTQFAFPRSLGQTP